MNRPLKKVACIILLGKGYLCAGRAQVLDEFGENAYNDVYEGVGECGCPTASNFDFDSIVCGHFGLTFPSQCALECHARTASVTVETKARRCQECDCPPDIHIVCGRNGQEYINPCYAMCDGTTVDAAGHCATFQLHELL